MIQSKYKMAEIYALLSVVHMSHLLLSNKCIKVLNSSIHFSMERRILILQFIFQWKREYYPLIHFSMEKRIGTIIYLNNFMSMKNRLS